MPRELTDNTVTVSQNKTGVRMRRVLQIDFPTTDESGLVTGYTTTWYSTEQFSFAVGDGGATTIAKVKNWGSITTQADPNKVGGNSQLTIELSDTDHGFKTLFDTYPGIQMARTRVWLWLDSTPLAAIPWSGATFADAVCIFGGTISQPVTWMESTGTYRCTLKGYEVLFDRNLSVPLTRDRFPDVQCTDFEGQILPLVYGNPAIRVPCPAIQRPGYGLLRRPLGIHDSVLYLNLTASQAHFTSGTSITIIVGQQGGWEAITGSFAGPNTNVFTITSRGSIEASGASPGVFAEDGQSYFLVNRSDVTNPNNTRNGQPIWTQHTGDTGWHEWTISYWFQEGSEQCTVLQPSDYSFNVGDLWKIGRLPGIIPFYQAGTPVQEKAPWVFAANFCPSNAVIRVEAKSTIQDPSRGGSRNIYLSYSNDASVYTVQLNNTSFNAVLGRGSGAPGITTITTARPPAYYNFDDDHLYVSLAGCTIAGSAGHWTFDNPLSDPINNPVDVIAHMLCSSAVGNIDQVFIDQDAFAAAWTLADEIPLVMGFAITQQQRLHQTASEIAFQGMMLYFWDCGKAVVQFLKVQPDPDDKQMIITNSNRRKTSLQTDQYDVREVTTELASTFSLSQSSPQVTMTRSVPTAVAVYGLRIDTIDLYGYQIPTQVALVTEFWLAYRLNRQRTAKFDCFLDALILRPGDTILLNFTDGPGNSIFTNVPARVYQIQHQSADAMRQTMERLTITVEYVLFPWTVTAVIPPLRDCTAWIGTATGPVADNLPIGGLPLGTTGGAPIDSGMPTPLGQQWAMVPNQLDGSSFGDSVDWTWAILTADLTAPTSFSGPTLATVDAYMVDPTSMATPPALIISTDPDMLSLPVENYLVGIGGRTGQQCAITKNLETGRWQIRWVRPQSAIRQGKVTTGTTGPTIDSWTRPQSIVVTEYLDDPTSSSSPRPFIGSITGLTVIVRQQVEVPNGSYVQWNEATLADGTIERELVFVKQSVVHQGVATSAITSAITNSWTGATTITADEYIDNPADGSTPRKYITGTTGLTITVRDMITIAAGSYIEWIEKSLSDGTIERVLSWMRPPLITLHQGLTTSAFRPTADGFASAGTVTATEYIPDPAGGGSPIDFIPAGSATIAVRSNVQIGVGTYCQWMTITLPNGATENELTYVAPKNVYFHQGKVTTALTVAPTNGWTNPGVVLATEFVDDPTDTSSPRKFVAGSTGVPVIVRDSITIQVGSYIEWQSITLSDGSTENELSYVRASASGLRFGLVSVGIDVPAGDPWLSPQTITVLEYFPDPTSTGSPRQFTTTRSAVTVVVRDQRAIRKGQAVEFVTLTLQDGTVENELTFCKPVIVHQGYTSSVYTKIRTFDRKTNPGTVGATEIIDDPTDTSFPRGYIDGSTATVVIRSNIPSIPTNTYIEWHEVTLADGSIENILSWADC